MENMSSRKPNLRCKDLADFLIKILKDLIIGRTITTTSYKCYTTIDLYKTVLLVD